MKGKAMAVGPKGDAKRAVALVAKAAAGDAPDLKQIEASVGTAEVKQIEASVGAAEVKQITDQSAGRARRTMEMNMEQVTKTAEGFFKAAEEAAEFGRGNMEAVAKVAQTLTTGMQDLGKQAFAVAQSVTDQALESAKAMAAVKSLKEAAEIQASFTKSAFERSLSETAKLQEASFRLAEQAYAPLTARFTLAVEKFGKPLAA